MLVQLFLAVVDKPVFYLIHFYVKNRYLHKIRQIRLVGGLLPIATRSQNGFLPKSRGSVHKSFSSGVVALKFNDIYSLQPFFIATYHNGRYGCTLFNPSLYKDTETCKAINLGNCPIKIFVKAEDPNIFLKSTDNRNGNYTIEFIDKGNANVTIIDYQDFDLSEYSEVSITNL